MKRKGLLLATVFFLCALLFMPQEKTGAAAFNLVKKVATVSVPKGRIVRTAKGRRYRYGTRKYLKMRWAKIGKYIYHLIGRDTQTPDLSNCGKRPIISRKTAGCG